MISGPSSTSTQPSRDRSAPPSFPEVSVLVRRPRGAREGACLLVAALVLAGAGCHSYAPVRATQTSPRTREVSGRGDYTWDVETGWKLTVQGTWGEPGHARVEAIKAFEAEAYADALLGFQQARDSLPPESPLLPEIYFYLAECHYFLGRYTVAVEHYRLVYRSGRANETIMNQSFLRVYEIALDYLSGKAGTSFLIRAFRVKGPGEGVVILTGQQDGLITEFPYLPFADDALMEIARHYYESENFEEAESYYQRVVVDYPGREWRETAQFQLAMSVHGQIRGVDYDHSILLRADRHFRRYLDENPRGEQADAAREKLRELTEMQGESYLRIAKFYLRDSQVRAAKLYLRIVMEKYTTTTAAEEAREISRQVERLESGSS